MAVAKTFPFDSLREDRFSPSYDGNRYTNADRVQKVQFGDGYAQYIRDGANWQKHTFEFKWANVEFTPLDKLEIPVIPPVDETPELPDETPEVQEVYSQNVTNTFVIPGHGDCWELNVPVGNIIFAFLEDVRTITPFNFRIPKLGITKQVRCTGYSMEHTSFNTVTINMSVETDYTLG